MFKDSLQRHVLKLYTATLTEEDKKIFAGCWATQQNSYIVETNFTDILRKKTRGGFFGLKRHGYLYEDAHLQ